MLTPERKTALLAHAQHSLAKYVAGGAITREFKPFGAHNRFAD